MIIKTVLLSWDIETGIISVRVNDCTFEAWATNRMNVATTDKRRIWNFARTTGFRASYRTRVGQFKADNPEQACQLALEAAIKYKQTGGHFLSKQSPVG